MRLYEVNFTYDLSNFIHGIGINSTLYSRILLERTVIDLHFHVNITQNWMFSFFWVWSLLFPPAMYKTFEAMMIAWAGSHKNILERFLRDERSIYFLWPALNANCSRILYNWIIMSVKDKDKRLASYVSFITLLCLLYLHFVDNQNVLLRSSRKNNLFHFMVLIEDYSCWHVHY